MTDLKVFGNIYAGVKGIKASDTEEAIITFGEGGGSSPISLIDTIVVSENTRAVSIDVTLYSAYDLVIIYFDSLNIAPSADWLYTNWNTTTPSGGSYTSRVTTLTGTHAIGYKATDNDIRWIWDSYSGSSAPNKNESASIQNIYMYTYNASNYITAGSTIKIYGGKYADL